MINMIQPQCPYCRSNDVFKTTTGKIIQKAASFGGGFIEGVVKETANGLIFDGAGHLVPKFGKSIACLAPVEYICNSCDCLFKIIFYSDGDIKEIALKKSPVPDEIIEEVRAEYIQSLRKKKPYLSMIIFALITLYCLIYLFIGVAENDGLRVALCFYSVILFAIPAILKFKKMLKLNNQIAECESQTNLDLKRSHRNLFSQYSQYN